MRQHPLIIKYHRLRTRLGAWGPLVVSQCTMLLVFASATWAYSHIEGWSLWDSFYMVVITLSTVGFQEVHPMSNPGRVLTTVLILTGVGNFAFILGAFSQLLVDGKLYKVLGRRRVLKTISSLRGHCVICGYGRIGSVVARELMQEGVSIVVVENDPVAVERLENDGIVHLAGDATSDDVLNACNIGHARALIAALSLDSANVYVVLSARQLNPGMTIIARAGDGSHIGKLQLAGADRVFLPHHLGGLRMAQSILRPTVTTFMELAHSKTDLNIQMEELTVGDASELAGKTLMASGIRQRFNLIVIGVKKPDGRMLFNPESTYELNPGDTLVTVGKPENFRQLQEIL